MIVRSPVFRTYARFGIMYHCNPGMSDAQESARTAQNTLSRLGKTWDGLNHQPYPRAAKLRAETTSRFNPVSIRRLQVLSTWVSSRPTTTPLQTRWCLKPCRLRPYRPERIASRSCKWIVRSFPSLWQPRRSILTPELRRLTRMTSISFALLKSISSRRRAAGSLHDHRQAKPWAVQSHIVFVPGDTFV